MFSEFQICGSTLNTMNMDVANPAKHTVTLHSFTI